ncbi:unnamed protein product [Polarella glacialis]|uniref:Uncharacterized protein n=1 Tax=Polarella glacialis TaxID=89957 RepID=A0A813GG44_POLGL|nr:unnamed protein product [Polarella glacialis]
MRGKTLPRLGSPPIDEIDQPGETCPVTAAFMVLRDMTELKYRQQLDESDFASKAKARCCPGERLSPLRLAEALNAEPALKLKDSSNDRLFQIQLSIRSISTFSELQGLVRRWPGTACALAAVAMGKPGRNVQLVAVFREAYSDSDALVARVRAKSVGRMGPLHEFTEDSFHGAVVLEPIIDRVLKYEAESSRMLDLQVPSVSLDFERRSQSSGVLSEAAQLASRTCKALADISVGVADNEQAQRGAAASCVLAAELMACHSSVLAVQISGCKAIGGLIHVSAPSLPLRQASVVIEAVMAAMRRHPGNPEVQEAACAAVTEAAASSPEFQGAAATNGAVDEIVAAMRRFPGLPEFQAAACGALAGLAANHPMNQSAVAASRGIEAIAAGMERFPEHGGLQAMACGALGNLAANHLNNQATVAANGGIRLVLDTLRRHSGTPSVLTAALGALWCVVKRHKENLAVATQLGATELAVTVVQKHPGDNALRCMASGALQVLVPGLSGALLGTSAPSSARPMEPASPD